MNKTLIAAVILSGGAATSAWAQAATPPATSITAPLYDVSTTKLGVLSVTLNNQFQAYQKGSGANNWGVKINPPVPEFPNRFWSITSYDYLVRCLGTVQYTSNTRQINNKTIIDAINVALSNPGQIDLLGGVLAVPGSPYVGKFGNTTAKIVVVNYDNLAQYPPYPPTEDNYYSDAEVRPTVWNAPWVLNNDPLTGANVDVDGQPLILNWPNQNYISWGKPDENAETFTWIGTRVFIIDPKNANPNLRCFDVTPFFAFEESFCKFCWDTMDRVTDGKIVRNAQLAVDSPCAGIGLSTCGVSGSGTTKFYWTVKFNNVRENSNLNPNYLLLRYYETYLGFDPAWGLIFGTSLDDANIQASQNALAFTVSGIATYKWSFKKLSDGLTYPVGTFQMTSAGFGYSPLCGVFSGPVNLTESDRASSQFGGVWCVSP